METSISYIGGEHAFFSSDERKWCNKIAKFKEDHPDDVEIIRAPDQNDGCVYCKIPVSWVELRPKTKRELTDEQRVALIERLRKANQKTP